MTDQELIQERHSAAEGGCMKYRKKPVVIDAFQIARSLLDNGVIFKEV